MASAKSRTNIKADIQSVPQGPDRFYNRELSWLQFNHRVLEEASNRQHPCSSACDFSQLPPPISMDSYMVRAAGVLRPLRRHLDPSQDGLNLMQRLLRSTRWLFSWPPSRPFGFFKFLAGTGIHVLQGDGATPLRLEQLFLTHI